jgi:NTE family protein
VPGEPALIPGNGARDALVLSGGGARGAFEIGVMKALFEGAASTTRHRPFNVGIFTGTSVGAYNAAFLAQEEEPGVASIARLEAIWRDRIADTLGSCGNGVYRLRADPLQFLESGCLSNPLQLFGNLARDLLFWSGYAAVYGERFVTSDEPLKVRVLETFNLGALFSEEPFQRLLAETLDLFRLRASPNALDVAVSDWENGQAAVFGKTDVIRLGTDAIRASASIPGIFPPVRLEGILYVDGGLLMNTPIKPAIQEGADVIHVIFVDPETVNLPIDRPPNTLDTFYRIYTILLATQINSDARQAATINEEITALAAGAAMAGEALPAVRARRARRMRRVTAPSGSAEKLYKPLTIHSYRPLTDLMGAEAFLDFSLANINLFIEQGYERAVNHNCIQEGCVLPPGVPPAVPLEPNLAVAAT